MYYIVYQLGTLLAINDYDYARLDVIYYDDVGDGDFLIHIEVSR